MRLSVIVPVLNEKDNIGDVIENILKVDTGTEKQIVIVDDGSTDGSTEIIRRFEKKYPGKIKAIYRKKRGGKGRAIRAAAEAVTGDIILIQDADMEYNINDYPALIKPFIDNSADVVFGSRFLGKIYRMSPLNLAANKILVFTANLLYGIRISDEATAYKAFSREVFKKLDIKSNGFEFCPEVVAKTAKMKCRIVDVPVRYEARSVKQGKKIRWQDAFTAVWTLVKYRF